MRFRIRAATAADAPAIAALLPRLAAFAVPERRDPADLWRGDESMILAWARGDEPSCQIQVAESESDTIVGAAVARLREEMLSGEPSAHLEVLTVASSAEGNGIGRALIAAAEEAARAAGALTLTLHVFANNTRARGLYERLGYDGELLRYIKNLG